VAFTSDPTNRWGALWLNWPEFHRFWAQVSRYLARAPAPAHFKTSFSHRGNITNIVVEALDAEGNFPDKAEFGGVLTDRLGGQYPLQFSQTAPGRYEAEVSSSDTLFGKIYRMEGGGIREDATVQFAGARNREFDPNRGDGRALLQRLADKIVESPDQLRFWARASEEIHPVRNQLLQWAAFLFLIDVASRKIHFRRLRLREKQAFRSAPVEQSPIIHLISRKRMIRKQHAPLEAVLEQAVEKSEPEASVMSEEPPPVPPQPDDYMKRLKEAKKKHA